VIEALRDRIDVVVQALAFNPRFLAELLTRIEEASAPEEVMPRQVIFAESEVDRMQEEIRAVVVPGEVLRRLEFFASQFEFCEVAADQFEYKTKDTGAPGGRRVARTHRAGDRARPPQGPGLPDEKRLVRPRADDAAHLLEGPRLLPRQPRR